MWFLTLILLVLLGLLGIMDWLKARNPDAVPTSSTVLPASG